MRTLLLVETRKIVDTRAGRWLIAVVALTCVGGSVGLALWGGREVTPSFQAYVGLLGTVLATLLPILGVLTATSEWSQRTGLVTFALEPRRGRVLAAKAAGACLVALTVLATGLVTSTVVHLTMSGGMSGSEISWSGLPGITLTVVIHVLQGLAFGFALLNTPLAIVALFLVPTAAAVATSFVEPLVWMAPWLDLGAVTVALTQGLSTVSGAQWQHLGVAVLVWVGLPMVVGYWRVTRQEIT